MVSRALSLDSARDGESVEPSRDLMCFVYILRCADESFYVGITQDLDARLKAHNGRGATYTFKRRPVSLVYSERYESDTQGVARERQLKRWSHSKKQTLISGDLQKLKRLSKSSP
jgi:predicted GIY-YIG superfamily endonuclease